MHLPKARFEPRERCARWPAYARARDASTRLGSCMRSVSQTFGPPGCFVTAAGMVDERELHRATRTATSTRKYGCFVRASTNCSTTVTTGSFSRPLRATWRTPSSTASIPTSRRSTGSAHSSESERSGATSSTSSCSTRSKLGVLARRGRHGGGSARGSPRTRVRGHDGSLRPASRDPPRLRRSPRAVRRAERVRVAAGDEALVLHEAKGDVTGRGLGAVATRDPRCRACLIAVAARC